MEGGEEMNSAPVVAGGDASEVFELVEEAFDPVAQSVGDGVMRDDDLAGAGDGMTAVAPVSPMR